jgi:DNA-binding protein YbaB
MFNFNSFTFRNEEEYMKMKIKVVVIAFVAMIAMHACGGKGIEIGNPPGPEPSISVSELLITPLSGDEIYKATFLDQENVSVSRYRKVASMTKSNDPFEGTVFLERVVVQYIIENSVATFTITFEDGLTITISMTLTDEGNVESIAISIGNQVEEADFDVLQDIIADPIQALEDATLALRSQNVESARDNFCAGLAGTPDHSQLAFGCFWTKMMLLPETPEMTALLAAFDEEPFQLEEQLSGPDGLFQNLDRFHSNPGFPFMNYREFDLPFSDFYNDVRLHTHTQKLATLMNKAALNGIDIDDLQDMIDATMPHFAELEGLLEVVLADEDFSYVIPAELFNFSRDIDVTYNDARLLMSATKGMLAGIDILNAYDYGIDISKSIYYNSSSWPNSLDFDQAIMVADLNGTGELVNGVQVDDVATLVLEDADRMANAKERVRDSILLHKTAVQEIIDGAPSRFAASIVRARPLVRYLDRLGQVVDSIDHGWTHMSTFQHALNDRGNVLLNLRAFFDNPPSSTQMSINAGDPFVLENGKIKPVERFFEEFFGDVLERL